ncbi:MAG TPA: SDR family NAD(P)-dependent oxidoreductase [Caulobacteraceae bacterium]|jgi:NAD(P)-dependent dehydrogenase (short-subunit alcohol dehydrogenase family)
MGDAGRPLAGRVAVVTGASRGIGAAAALSLGAAGARVIAAGRTQGALEALDDAIRTAGGEAVSLVPMDLTDGGGIDQLGMAVFERHKRLDILVHAAGMLGGLRPVAHTPPPLWEKLVATNLTSAFRLIRSLEPLLRASDRGRAIFITCEQARTPKAFWGAYAATKAGLEAMVRSWADEVDNTAIRAILVDPGPVRTALRAQAFPGEEKEVLTDPAAIGALILELAAASGDPGPPDRVVTFSGWAGARAGAAPGRP